MLPLIPALLCFAPSAATPDDSLEDLLRRARAEREQQAAAIGDTVEAVMLEFEVLSDRNRDREADRRRKKLIDLGPEVAPLLLPYLETGTDPGAGVTFRAGQAVRVLRELASPSITDALIAALGQGTIDARLNALAVLENCPEPKRAAPPVRDLYHASTGRLRTAAMLTLARLGGPEAEELLSASLEDENESVVDLALGALASVESPTAMAKVLQLCRDERGSKHVLAVGLYFAAQPQHFEDQEVLISLMELMSRTEAPRGDIVRVMRALTDLDLEIRSKVRKSMDPLVEHAHPEVQETTLILLARAGDKSARRDLLRPYNDKVTARRDDDAVYTDRAGIWYRIDEFQESIKDYKQAVKLMRGRTKEEEPFLGLARCYARMKKYKDAKAQLDLAPVSIARLQEISKDPAFKEMLESKYRSAFHLPDEDE